MLLIIEVPTAVGKAALEEGASAIIHAGDTVLGEGVVHVDASAAMNVVGEFLEEDRAENGGLDG